MNEELVDYTKIINALKDSKDDNKDSDVKEAEFEEK